MRSARRSDSWVLSWLLVLASAALLRLLGVGGSMAHLRLADVVLGPAIFAYTVSLEAERRLRRRDQEDLDERVAAWRAARRVARRAAAGLSA